MFKPLMKVPLSILSLCSLVDNPNIHTSPLTVQIPWYILLHVESYWYVFTHRYILIWYILNHIDKYLHVLIHIDTDWNIWKHMEGYWYTYIHIHIHVRMHSFDSIRFHSIPFHSIPSHHISITLLVGGLEQNIGGTPSQLTFIFFKMGWNYQPD